MFKKLFASKRNQILSIFGTLLILMLFSGPIFSVLDPIFQPQNKEIHNAKVVKNDSDAKVVVENLKNRKQNYDKMKKDFEKTRSGANQVNLEARKYNNLMNEHKDLEIWKSTDLPKKLEPVS